VQTEFGNKFGQMDTQYGQEIATLRKEIMSVEIMSRGISDRKVRKSDRMRQ